MSKQRFDAKLSDIAELQAVWLVKKDYINPDKRTIQLTFHVKGEVDDTGRPVWTTRVVKSYYFSNYSIDVVTYNNKRYLIDSKMYLVEAGQ